MSSTSGAPQGARRRLEFVARQLRDWLQGLGTSPLNIEPGSSWENGNCESFNGKLREECLNGEIFYSLKKARIVIEQWRQQYNRVRPHAALGYRPLAPGAYTLPWNRVPRHQVIMYYVSHHLVQNLVLVRSTAREGHARSARRVVPLGPAGSVSRLHCDHRAQPHGDGIVSVRRSLAEKHPHLAGFVPFLDDLNKESERGAVLIASAYIEDQLSQIIAAFLIESVCRKQLLEGFNAPLGTFSARATAAEALGLISEEEYCDLTSIRKIRNEFAHSHRATFSNVRVVQMCGNLKHSAKDYGGVVVDARAQFTTAAVALILQFTNRPQYVSRKRLKREAWPY